MLRQVHDALLAAFGPQGWWPADGPFEVAVGAVLTQNTAWRNVERAISDLREAELLSPRAMIDAPHGALAAAIRPSGYFNVKARRLKALCRHWLDLGGADGLAARDTDDLRRGLLTVTGVGPETADDIVLYAFDRPVFVIDAYTRRILSRLGIIDGDEGYDDLRGRIESRLGSDTALFNEYHALLVRLGKDICRPAPRCGECPLENICPVGRGAA